MWEPYKKGFKAYLQLEKSLSDNSVQAYLRDGFGKKNKENKENNSLVDTNI